MRKIDILVAFLAGEGVTCLVYGLMEGYGMEIKFWSLILAIFLPILALIGLWISFLLGKKFLWIFQAAKFLLIGVLATLVDLGVLNLLIWISGITAGLYFSIFKGFSFIVATSSKYLGDKFWVFEKMEKAGIGKEFGQFFAVTLISLIINVGTASLIVNVIGPQFGAKEIIWANVGGITAAFGSAIWNFLGYKFVVFKK